LVAPKLVLLRSKPLDAAFLVVSVPVPVPVPVGVPVVVLV
jgi:hypothetical protein